MANKFVLNYQGVSELLHSDTLASELQSIAQSVADNAGDGYVATSFVGFDRVHGYASTSTKESEKDNYDNNTLLKSAGGVKK